MEDSKLNDKKICVNCKLRNTSISKTGRHYWYNSENGKLCQKCYMKLIHNPKWSERMKIKYHDTPKEFFKIRDGRRLKFKDKRILVKENPRTGICSVCGKVTGIDCKRTNIHHMEYHEDDPLKDTIELCPGCHIIEHKKKVRKLSFLN